ncbi:sulfite exporter TauE/SafE family protein [Maribellus maritimus]|uniref:sulfite exporter TauE/SafE family protein n=1 Tax=Maribellus maritimus TaxID=2870838 RepID=UPI001EEC0E8E|nr:sulfite exporter TauE/SafE family protein [Maribellus maritimus]MCG6186589.1 sulfite exporter TauE/SafE family protein [Maribellus maritimus]
MTILLSAFLLGLMGSFHCAGMCGPIAIALPLHGNTVSQKIFGGALYNIGRTLTYGIMGAVFGLLGQGIQMIGFQQKVSVLMGGVMIVSVLFPALFRNQYSLDKSWFSVVGKLKKSIGQLFTIRSFSSLFFIGLLNGLLPCGLVYMAIAGAIGVGNVGEGSLYMILFGLGTIPMLLAISLAGNVMSLTVRKRINRLIPVLVVVVGLLFILRGLSLGIPYLSPPKQKIEQKFEKSLEKNSANLHWDSKPECCSIK